MTKPIYWVYILLCENDHYYTGYTNDLVKRYKAHLNGTASKYTRSFKPVRVVQSWEVAGKAEAMRVERKIKLLSRDKKEMIIKTPALLEIN